MSTSDICGIVSDEVGQLVTEDTRLDMLNLDSLDFINLMRVMEAESGMTIPDAAPVWQAKTVGDLIKELV